MSVSCGHIRRVDNEKISDGVLDYVATSTTHTLTASRLLLHTLYALNISLRVYSLRVKFLESTGVHTRPVISLILIIQS